MDDQRLAARTTWLVGAGFLIVTVSSAMAVFQGRSTGDTATVAFVVTTNVTLLLLLSCLRDYERAPPGDEAGPGGPRGHRRIRIRRVVWCLTTLLTVMFASRVAGVMPCLPAVILVWALAVATTIGGFVALFH